MPARSERVPKLRTQTAIAAVYAVNQTTVRNWMRDDTFPSRGDDGAYDLAEVGEWVRANNDPETARERARKLRLEADRLEIKLQQEKGESIPASEVEAEWSSIAATLWGEMEKTRKSISPQVAGKDAAEILAALEDRDRELMNTVADGDKS